MESFKTKIVPFTVTLRVENNKTFDVPGFNAEDFLKSLKTKNPKKTKIAEPVKITKEVEVDLLETLPPHFFFKEDEHSKVGEGLTEHQRLVVLYMNVNTPYRGLLLYHGLGAGLACTSVAVAEAVRAKTVFILTPRGQNFKDQVRQCGGDLDKFRFSSFALEASCNPFEDAAVVIDEVHRFTLDDPNVKRVYEWIVAASCRVVALSSTPIVNNVGQLGVIFNMVRGNVKMFRVEKDWSDVAGTVHAHRGVEGASILVRNPPGFVNVLEEGKVVWVKKGDYMSDAEFQEKTMASVTEVAPFPVTDKEFLKLSEEGFKRRISGLVAYFPTQVVAPNPTVVHLVKGSKTEAMVASLGKRSLVFTQGFLDFKEELEKNGFLPIGKKTGSKVYAEYTDEDGEEKRRMFQKSKGGVFLLNSPDEIDLDVTEVHMAGVEFFEQLCSRKTVVTPHVYLSSAVDKVVSEKSLKGLSPEEKKFKAYRAAKEDLLPWLDCMRESAINCALHGIRCYSKQQEQPG